MMSSLNNYGWAHFSLNGEQTHHPELLQFLVAFDEERTLPISCPVAVALASPTCSKKQKTNINLCIGLEVLEKLVHNLAFLLKNKLKKRAGV